MLVSYADEPKRPAILGRVAGAESSTPRPGLGHTHRGRVVLMTTKLDGDGTWNNYLDTLTSFYLALAWRTCGYLAGDAEETNLNFLSGQVPLVPLPLKPRYPDYTLRGPGLIGAQAILTRRNDDGRLSLREPTRSSIRKTG